MSIWDSLRGLPSAKPIAKRKSNVERFLDGETDTLAANDIVPGVSAAVARFEQAHQARKEGRLKDAERLLLPSIRRPSIYKGHYRELFLIWRQFNREDLKAGNYQAVIKRVERMAAEDERMIQKMVQHWSKQQKRALPKSYFDKERNLKATDIAALKKAAKAVGNVEAVELASKLEMSLQ